MHFREKAENGHPLWSTKRDRGKYGKTGNLKFMQASSYDLVAAIFVLIMYVTSKPSNVVFKSTSDGIFRFQQQTFLPFHAGNKLNSSLKIEIKKDDLQPSKHEQTAI